MGKYDFKIVCGLRTADFINIETENKNKELATAKQNIKHNISENIVNHAKHKDIGGTTFETSSPPAKVYSHGCGNAKHTTWLGFLTPLSQALSNSVGMSLNVGRNVVDIRRIW